MHPILSEIQARQWMEEREREAAARRSPGRQRTRRWTIGALFAGRRSEPTTRVGRLEPS